MRSASISTPERIGTHPETHISHEPAKTSFVPWPKVAQQRPRRPLARFLSGVGVFYPRVDGSLPRKTDAGLLDLHAYDFEIPPLQYPKNASKKSPKIICHTFFTYTHINDQHSKRLRHFDAHKKSNFDRI